MRDERSSEGLRMEIVEPNPLDRRATHELKVKLPLHLLLRLHSHKVISGKTIAQTITEALDLHLSRLKREG